MIHGSCCLWWDYKAGPGQKFTSLVAAKGDVYVPVQKSDGVAWDKVSVLYPHRLFATLYQDHPDKFSEYFLGNDPDNIRNFWSEMERHPAYAGHPMHTHPKPFQRYALALKVYGDGTPTTGAGHIDFGPSG